MSRSASWKGRGKAFGLLLAVLQLAQFSRIMIDRFGQGSICLQRDRQEAGVSSMVQGEVPGPRSMCVGQTESAVIGHRLRGELLHRLEDSVSWHRGRRHFDAEDTVSAAA